VLPINASTLVIPLVGMLDGERLDTLLSRALNAIAARPTRRLVLDITGVPMIDAQVAEGLMRVPQAARLLGAEVVLVGISPEVAQTVVGLGLDFAGLRTASTLHDALGSSARAVVAGL
jgi:rsbT co-antagonist protein RsbR